jgi:hypothetical protein
MTEPAGAGQPFPRAFLSVAGVSLARHQLGLALALDCQRVICLARNTSPEIIALQHVAEDAGLQFAIAANSRQLVSFISPDDDVVVMGEGLFAEPASVVPLMSKSGSLVLVQPVEGALAAGYERIDLNRASAGIIRMPGKLVENLQGLPPDFDVCSALLRIALQSGAEMREVPVDVRTGADWRLVRTEAEAVELENEWLRQRFSVGVTSPGRAAARAGVLALGSSLLHAGNASNALSAAVVATLGIGAVLAWFNIVWAAFFLTAIAWVIGESGRLLRSAERRVLGLAPPAIPRSDLLLWVIDAIFALLVLIDEPRFAEESLISWVAVPAILMLLLTLLPRVVGGRAASWITDRLLLGILLAIASIAEQTLPAVQIISVILIIVGLILPTRSRD